MKDIFISILEVSITGSVLILLVLAMRLILRKAPKRLVCLLWLLVGIRLLVPFHIETEFSLQPDLTDLKASFADVPFQEAGKEPPLILPSATADSESAENTEPQDAEVLVVDKISVAIAVWAAGMAGMLLYMAVSYLRLKRQVREAVVTQDGSWELEGMQGAFLFGYLRPRIYLPAGLDGEARQYVLSHERSHIRRGDHWVKLIGFVCLAVHWFNPLVWVAYALLCRDLEMACDEQAVMNLTLEERKQYSEALLSCSGKSRNIAACPIAFGETSVKERIMNILNYKKPGFWISLVCILLIAATAVFLLTDATPKYDTVFEEYASLVGAHKSELADKAGIKEEDLIYERHEFYLPEPVIFNGSEFLVSFYAGEDTQDRINGIAFRKSGYESIEALAEDLVLIEQALYKAYGTTVYEHPIFSDEQQVLETYTDDKSWRAGVAWAQKDTAPYPLTQKYMQEMLTWDSIKQIAIRRWGESVRPEMIFSVDVLAGDYELDGLSIEVAYKIIVSRKDSWEE